MVTADQRLLPVYAAGAVEVPFVIDGFGERVERDTHWSAHSHPTHELLWNERGASQLTVGPRTWTVTPGFGLWVPAGLLHSGRAPAGTWYRATHFGIATVASISESPATVEITPLLRLLLDRLAKPDLEARSRTVTEQLVLDILVPSPHELAVHTPSSSLLAPIARAAREHPGDTRTLAQWAERLGVSTRTITRAFHSETGVGFARWMATVRAQHAITLLASGEHLEEIAAELGYSSTSAFGAAFRRTTGLTPGSFRRD